MSVARNIDDTFGRGNLKGRTNVFNFDNFIKIAI